MKNRQASEHDELLDISSGEAEHVYYWHCGHYISRFLLGLRDKKTILGIKCSGCGRVYVPPREVCGRCFKTMDQWVDLGTEGSIYAFTVVKLPYIDPNTGKPIKVPRTDVYVKLDGADTCLMHWLDEADENKITVGARVRAIFKQSRRGTIHDIECFTQI
jgi:uncharacterized OB-fold protein